VFGKADGAIRLSPGKVTARQSAKKRFEHDCSTLGGSSGSCVVDFAGHCVVGLHFGGVDVDELTGRGTANVAIMLAALGDHPAVEQLRG
jgi:V8-like Glu-specific endopeptidase